MMAVRKKLGDLLIEGKAIDELQLKAALAHQRQWGGRLGRILVEMRFVQEQQICDAVARQLGIPSVRLLGRSVDPKLLEVVPLELCERHWLFPLALVPGERGGEKLQLAMSDPTNLAVVDELRFRTGKHIEVAVAPDSQIDAAIRRHFYGETVSDQRPRPGGPLSDVQFGGQEVDLSEAPPAAGHAIRAAPVPMAVPAPASGPLPTRGDVLDDLFGTPSGTAHDELEALLGFSDPGGGPASSMGAEGIDSARRALFAAPGGLAPEVEDAPSPAFSAAAWVPAGTPPPAWSAPAPLQPPGWPPRLDPVSGPAAAGARPAAPAPAGAAEEDPIWGEPDLLEELELGVDEAPLVVGTLIESREEPAEEEVEAAAPVEDALELDPGVSEPIDPEDPLDPLADEAALVAALESMAAGHEEPVAPGRLVAALALALIRKGAVRGADLLEELRR